MELEVAASTVEVTDTGVKIRWSDGAMSRFHALWLRDNCSTGGPKGAEHRIFSVVDLNPELFVLDAEREENGDLFVEFSDGHESVFDFDWLRAHSHEAHDRRGGSDDIDHVRAGVTLPWFDLPRRGSAGHGEMLDALVRTGVVQIGGVPTGPTGKLMVVDLFSGVGPDAAPVLESASIDTDLDVIDGGALQLDLHTLEAVRAIPTGLLVLGPSEDNGVCDLVVVDGFAVATELNDLDPDAYDMLTDTAVPFVASDDADGDRVRQTLHASVISLDHHRQLAGVRFDERAIGPLDVDPSEVGAYYRALISFATMLRDPGRAVHVTVRAGEVLVVDNHRMLCGGTRERSQDVVARVSREDFTSMRRQLQPR